MSNWLMPFGTIIQQILILGILALTGVFAVRFNVLSVSAKEVIEKLVFYITLPLMIITKLSTLEFSPIILQNGIFVIVMTYIIILVQILVGSFVAKLLKLEASKAVIHTLHTFLGNIVFLGFPLLDALFPGGEAILYAALYQLTMNTVLWTWGIGKLDQKTPGRKLKKLLNPNTIALVSGLLLMGLHIPIPEIAMASLGGLGKTTLYLAMLYIGILLSETAVWQSLKQTDTLILSLNKLLILPIGLLLGLQWIIEFAGIPVNQLALSVVIIEAAMPCMTILVILAKRYGANDLKAMENFVVSTILSIITLPLVIYIIHQFNL
ncbi:MAG: AEC family transporter [Bacteroidetes bacterium]|nr:AEC family transporter [Bacteroidota bacterium]